MKSEAVKEDLNPYCTSVYIYAYILHNSESSILSLVCLDNNVSLVCRSHPNLTYGDYGSYIHFMTSW